MSYKPETETQAEVSRHRETEHRTVYPHRANRNTAGRKRDTGEHNQHNHREEVKRTTKHRRLLTNKQNRK